MAVAAWPSTSSLEIGASMRALYSSIEPSGLLFHSGRNQLMVVGDEGQLMAMNADGTSAVLWNVGGDLEDLTVVDPNSNDIYLADEDGEIIRYDLSTSTILQTWNINGLMPETGGLGMEGLTYADGYFYAGYQLNGDVYKLDLSGSSVVLVDQFSGLSGATDLSGLTYKDGYLYALYNTTLAVMGLDGTVYESYSVPDSSDNEGVAVGMDSNNDGDANIFIASDSGKTIYSHDNFLIYGWTAPVAAPVDPDGDADGVVASLDCNDADAAVSTLQSYYTDVDLDGNGSDTIVELCFGSAPSGYSSNSNDNNDSIPNAGIEISADKIDNDGDGTVDEANLSWVDGLHPYYGSQDATISHTGKVRNFWGLRNGDYAVKYWDNSVFRFSLSDVRTNTVTTVSLVSGTAYLNVTIGGVTTQVSAYTGLPR